MTATVADSAERDEVRMSTGRIDYSPDYKSEPAGDAFLPESVAKVIHARYESEHASTEHARLEREVVEAAKKWATLRYQPHFGGMVALEDALQEATRALIEFESLQEKKD